MIKWISIKKKIRSDPPDRDMSSAIHLLNNWGLDIKESIHKDWKLKRIHKEVNIPL